MLDTNQNAEESNSNESVPAPEAAKSLGRKIQLSLETKRLIGEIEKEIAALDWDIPDLSPLDAAPRLAGPARHLLSAGGKRVRPLLVSLLSRALGIEFDEKMQICARAAELVHSATLLHDDVLDGARVRRGRISAHLKYDAHTSILSGDALLCKAMADVARLKEPEILLHLSLTLRDLVEGECLQADLVGTVHEELDSVLEVCRRKTGALFAWCGWVAGYSANRNADELRRFGKNLGLAFQLLDDVLDWESKDSGKNQFQDLAEAKLNTVAVVLCMKSSKARRLLKEAFSDLDENEEVKNVQELGIKLQQIREYNDAVNWVKAQAEKETAFALANLEVLPQNQWKDLVKTVTVELLNRMK